MKIVVPLEGRVRSVNASTALSVYENEDGSFNLIGDNFSMTDVPQESVLVLPDEADVDEGDEVSDTLAEQALPLADCLVSSTEEASADALGVLLRIAIADGKLTSDELKRLCPAIAQRRWRVGLEVQTGDIFTRYGAQWKCLQAHTTRLTRLPELSPLYWEKV